LDLRGELTELSLSEIRCLIVRLAWTSPHNPTHVLHWSHWRREHQARARRCHYATRNKRLHLRL
jgi:hypothetical protein